MGNNKTAALKIVSAPEEPGQHRRSSEENEETARIARWARRQALVRMDLSYGAKECWRILEAYPSGKSFPSHWHIAETLKKSRSSVRRNISELSRKGYVRVEARFGRRLRRNQAGQRSNNYIILDQPDLVAATEQLLQEFYAKKK